MVAVAEAKRELELARARLLVAGVEGKNEAQREAALRLELSPFYDVLHEAEQTLTEARCSLDNARLDWDVTRYTIRALELGR